MAVQTRLDVSNVPFIRNGTALVKYGTIVQDAGRSGDLVANTVLSYDPATAKWHPFTDETATDGTQFPKGINVHTITEAAIAAGDVADVAIWVKGEIVDSGQLVIENSLTLATVINAPAGINITVEECLRYTNIYVEDTVDVDGYENT